jgi:two-component system chemotaxis response regulator CheB
MSRPIRVLIVDDSAFMRQIFFRLLSNDPQLTVVATARDGWDALAKIDQYQPDVVTLDVAMPNMDGLECLTKIMRNHPLPVIMVSSLTIEGAEPTIQALELGAVDYVAKGSTTQLDEIEGLRQELIQKIKVAARVVVSKLSSPVNPSETLVIPKKLSDHTFFTRKPDLDLLAIGASTGGPKALYHLLPLFPADFPLGIVVAQHMPKSFTKVFAKRLDGICRLQVSEAQSGETIIPGKVVIAPSGRQSRVVRRNGVLMLEVSDEPSLLYKPSVDHLFHSIAASCWGKVIGVLLTGMGSDGANGMKELRDLGARTIAEAETSCVVFGMPRVAIELGAAEYVENLTDIFMRISAIMGVDQEGKKLEMTNKVWKGDD